MTFGQKQQTPTDQLANRDLYPYKPPNLTEKSGEMALLLFGLHLVYKLRNASSEIHKEKLILCIAVFTELLISTLAYLTRHALWHRLGPDHLLVLYAVRCQLTVTLTVALVFAPKVIIVPENFGARHALPPPSRCQRSNSHLTPSLYFPISHKALDYWQGQA